MDEGEQRLSLMGVGQDLRAAREAIGKQIKDAAQFLRIGAYHLEALEAGRYDDLPEAVYVHGFVRSYAGYLHLDADEMVRRVQLEMLPPIIPEELHFPAAPQDAPKPSRNLLILAALLVIGVIGFWYLDMGSERSTPPQTAATAPEAAPAPVDQIDAPPSLEESAAATATPSDDSAAEAEAAAPQIPPVDELVGEAAPPATATPDAASPAGAATAEPAEHGAIATPGEGVEDGAILAEQIGTAEISRQAEHAAAALQAGPEASISLPPSPPLVAEPAPPSAPAQSEAATAQPAVAPQKPAEPAENVALNQPVLTQELVRAPVVLRASSDTWMQISQSNGEVLKSWVMRAGEQYVPPADQPGLTALIGNAGALKVYIDGTEMPPLGEKGAVVRSVPLDAANLKSRIGG